MVVLSFVLPAVKEIYGPFWSAILGEIEKNGAQGDLYALYASLRLVNLLRKSYMLEANDDMLDAWSEKKAAVAKWLAGLLLQLRGKCSAFLISMEASGRTLTSCNSLDVNSVVLAPLLMI